MFQAVQERIGNVNIAYFSAAVSDYAIQNPAQQKIKKAGEHFTLELEKTKVFVRFMGVVERGGGGLQINEL